MVEQLSATMRTIFVYSKFFSLMFIFKNCIHVASGFVFGELLYLQMLLRKLSMWCHYTPTSTLSAPAAQTERPQPTKGWHVDVQMKTLACTEYQGITVFK